MRKRNYNAYWHVVVELFILLLNPLLSHRDNVSDPYPFTHQGASSITHLMYVDDILVFTKANPKSLNNIKRILGEFSLYSGLEINTGKSLASFFKVCEDNLEL